MKDRLVLRFKPDKAVLEQAAKLDLEVLVQQGWGMSFEKALFVEPNTLIPWELVPRAFDFLDKWDLACPLWRYGTTAADIGTDRDRKRTQKVVGDLRQLLYAHELLFVRSSYSGLEFLGTWLKEQKLGDEPRLAFLRAFHIVKPILCALPRTWQLDARQEDKVVETTRRKVIAPVQEKVVKVTKVAKEIVESPAPRMGAFGRVKVAPGVFIRCRLGEEQQALDRYLEQRTMRQAKREGEVFL